MTEQSPTDRGYVVLTELSDGTYNIEICDKVSPVGDPHTVYAKHVGVDDFVISPSSTFHERGNVRFSDAPLEVFVDADSNRLHIGVVHGTDDLAYDDAP